MRASTRPYCLGAALVVSALGIVTISTVQDLDRKVVRPSTRRAFEASREIRLGAEAPAEDKGPEVGAQRGTATPGAVDSRNDSMAGNRRYHVVVSTDGNHYTTWQTRIMYYWYLKAKAKHPDSVMGGFTRLLHSGKADKWMEEIPTKVVGSLRGGRAVDKGYPVLHRPNAFKQWLAALDIEEDYILMAEPDHLIVTPPPNWASYHQPAGYPFTYMNPKQYEKELGQFSYLSRNMEPPHLNMDPLGNSPVIIHKEKLRKIVPLWTELSLKMKGNRLIDKMYAFSLASAMVEEKPIRYDMHMEFMVQPPFDADLQVRACWPFDVIKRCPLKEAHIIHYTYGQDVNLAGKFTPGERGSWHWDKRDYTVSGVPKDIPPPPKGTGTAIVRLVDMINEAAAALSF